MNFWWEYTDQEELASSLTQHVEQVENEQSEIQHRHLKHSNLYRGRRNTAQSWGIEPNVNLGTNVRNNVVNQIVDTASSVVAKNKPKIRILTSGAEWSEQRKAKKLEKYLWAELNYRNVYDIGPDIFRDACVFGVGIMKILIRHGEVCVERVSPDELIVDVSSCGANKFPRELFHRRLYDRDELIALFPEKQREIEEANPLEKSWADYREVPKGKVVVIEAWRLPPAPGMPGRHCIVLDSCTLYDEEWTESWLPFSLFRWSHFDEFYGKGIVEELSDIQLRIYQLDSFIQKCQDLIAVPKVFVDVNSSTLKAHLNNDIGVIIPYRGSPPQFHTPQAVSAEIYRYRNELIQEAFQRVGLNQATAQAMVPTGVESAVAMREVSQRQDTRFSIQSQRYENFYKDVAWKFLAMSASCYESTKYKTRYEAKNLIECIPWKDVDLERDRFTLGIEAASIFTMSPAARLQTVTELAQVGVIGPQEMRRLLNHPDLEHDEALANADQEDIERVLEGLLDGNYESPEPFQNLMLGIKRIQLAYLKAKSDGAPEDILENMRMWLNQAQALVSEAQRPPEAAAQVPPGTAAQVAEQGQPIEPPVGPQGPILT